MDLLLEWLGVKGNLDLLRNGGKGKKREDGLRIAEEYIAAGGALVYRTSSAIKGEVSQNKVVDTHWFLLMPLV